MFNAPFSRLLTVAVVVLAALVIAQTMRLDATSRRLVRVQQAEAACRAGMEKLHGVNERFAAAARAQNAAVDSLAARSQALQDRLTAAALGNRQTRRRADSSAVAVLTAPVPAACDSAAAWAATQASKLAQQWKRPRGGGLR